ncbi:phasin family protein [Erythrobacteraceae bacterium CFH 75059]|uniref:phasin family protein n=1 Tax=Qipengyuania thermophila TaxID=2509361 RepID=UPI00101FF25E|nr:phasin family protein [Qipengyuania thermophila]TCD06788.1 phasin family protein [Erythrobacteraceae bacterium CFH 75059]
MASRKPRPNAKPAEGQDRNEPDLQAIAAAVAAPDSPAAAAEPTGAVEAAPAADTAQAQASVFDAAPPADTTDAKDTDMNDEAINTANEQLNTGMDALSGLTGDMQNRMHAFYERSTTTLSDMAELGRGNVEAVVEAGRVWTSGLQELGRSALEDSRGLYEGLSEDMRRMAAVKSPTELMQLQGELARRNMDGFIAHASRSTETMLKLINDAFTPVSNRMSVTIETLTKKAA